MNTKTAEEPNAERVLFTKTDKPYSLQDAKDEASKEWNRAFDFRSFTNGISVGNIKMLHIYPVIDRAMELYTSKATEELRKENESLRANIEGLVKGLDKEIHNSFEYQDQIERLKESNKVKDEAINGLREFNNTQDERWREYSKKLEDSNKELVEALRNAVAVYKKYANDNPEEDHIFNHCEGIIQKSEGDVNKKI